VPSRPIQISIDEALLERIDRDPEVAEGGRSAFLRAAATYYLAAKERREIDRAIRSAYGDEADAMIEEVAEFMDVQEWPGS
jgi:metal-responsive CopG/Arc/MetJ family transcriptional regulator